MFKNIEKLKDFDELVEFNLPDDSRPGRGGRGGRRNRRFERVREKNRRGSNQLLLIGSIIEGINHFCDRAAMFLLRDDKLVGWKGKGFSGENGQINDEDLKRIFFSLSANTVLKSVIETKKNYMGEPICKPDDFLIYNRFGGGKPKKIFVLPFFVKGKPQAVIYADSLAGTPIKSQNHRDFGHGRGAEPGHAAHPAENTDQDQNPGIHRGN